jgi:hypothetical protein
LSLASDQYDRFGWSDTGSHTERQARLNVLNLACRNGHTGCQDEAGRIFKQWVDNGKVSTRLSHFPGNVISRESGNKRVISREFPGSREISLTFLNSRRGQNPENAEFYKTFLKFI